MSSIARRIKVLEASYQPHEDNPYRIPDWMRGWLDPLSIEDLEILESAGWADGADGDLENLTPAERERYYELLRSWETFSGGAA